MKLTIFPLAALTLTLAGNARAEATYLDPTPAPALSSTRTITLDECISMALSHNLDVQIERFSPWLAQYDLSIARGGYDPVLTASAQHDYSETGTRLLTGNLSIPGTKSDDNSFMSSVAGSLPWGMTYSLQANAKDTYGRSSTNNFENTSGTASLSVTQPLLKNFWFNNTRLTILVSKNRIKYSEQALRQQIINTVSAVETAYYELIFARENVKVQERGLQLAEQLLSENKKRVEVGVLAPLDEKQAESQAAARRADLVAAQLAEHTAHNTLKKLVTDDYAASYGVTFQPGEALVAMSQTFNLQESWKLGLRQRPDLLEAKLDVERSGLQLKYYKNQVFPQLDVFGSYGFSGSKREFSGAIEDIRGGDLPLYTYGVQLSIPLSNVAARNTYKKGKVTVQQGLLTVKKIEQDVMVQIDDAIRTAQSAFERVDATHQARLYAEAALEAEQKKLENGRSTSFNVLSLQSTLTAARSAEIRALADYNEALTALAQNEASTFERRKIDVKMQ